MTPEELREIDRQVAEKVMGWVWQGGNPIGNGYDGRWPWPPPFSTDIAAAVEVAERVAKLAWHLSKIPGRYRCQIVLAASIDKCFEVEANTAPLAICKAALAALD